jgi:Flp pilus assembly protein TadB
MNEREDPQRDRQAYLEEQIARQKRGEPVDVAWVRAELERVRREQTTRLAASRRNLRVLVAASAVLLLVLWLRRGGLDPRTTVMVLGAVLVVALTAWAVSRRRRNNQ